MEKRSGVTFLQAQVAQARLWLGESYGQPNVQKTVAIKIPQKTQEGLVETSEESNKKVEQIPLPLTLDEARDIVRRFEHGADGIRGDEDVADSVAQHTLGDRTGLLDEKWLGTEEEERAA
jgi:phospholipase D1/2